MQKLQLTALLTSTLALPQFANVETTADLVETKLWMPPATEATANTSEEAATVSTDSATNLTTVTVSQEQTPDQPAVTANAVEPQTTNIGQGSTVHSLSDDQGSGTIKVTNGETSKVLKPLMGK